MDEGEELCLARDRHNPYDINAIEIMDGDGETLGYINKKLAEDLAQVMDEGYVLTCEVTEITGGEDGKNLGCNILINATGEKEKTWMDALVFSRESAGAEQAERPKNITRGPFKKFIRIVWRAIMILGLIVIGLFALLVWYALKTR